MRWQAGLEDDRRLHPGRPGELDQLLAAQSYPSDPMEVNRFYVTSKYLTGYLLLRQPREKWDAFFARLLAGDEASAALLETYGWADAAALEKSFAQFAR